MRATLEDFRLYFEEVFFINKFTPRKRVKNG